MKFYMIACHRGHSGSGRSTEIKFAIAAESMVHACKIARKMPSVKHTKLIIYGIEITEAEFLQYKKISAYDRYPQERRR